MAFERDRDSTPHARKVAEDQFELLLRVGSDGPDGDEPAEDSGYDSFLERFPPAARERRAPD